MRTTVEMKPEHRSRLLALAAKRGEKGFSGALEEALESYFEAEGQRERRAKEALALRGSLRPEEADELSARTQTIRADWR